MVDLDIINGTIAEWEAKDLTFLTVERLAWLYIVRDNALMRGKNEDKEEPHLLPTVPISSGSEFMEACSKSDATRVWNILDETMETIKILQPKLYDAVLQKLTE